MTDSLLNHSALTGSYFFPRQETPKEIFWVETATDRLACAYHQVDGAERTLVHYHGNGEVVADYEPYMAEIFAGFGLNTLFVEYRGYGASTGEPALAALLDDVPAVFEALDQPAEDLFVFGRSIGSLYAVEFAYRYPEIAGLILESGIADVLERILVRVSPRDLGADFQTIRDEVERLFNQEEKLGAYEKPLLVLHARRDHLVNVSHGQRLHLWAASLQKRLSILPQGDHNSIFAANEQEYLRQLKLFFSMHGKRTLTV